MISNNVILHKRQAIRFIHQLFSQIYNLTESLVH